MVRITYREHGVNYTLHKFDFYYGHHEMQNVYRNLQPITSVIQVGWEDQSLFPKILSKSSSVCHWL